MRTFLLLLFFSLFYGMTNCCKNVKTMVYQEKEKDVDSLVIKEGLVCETSQRIIYKRKDKKLGVITLSEPVMVAQAQQDEEWGFFQFPIIAKTNDNILIVTWQMKEDSHTVYGQKSKRNYSPMMSKDEGKTWQVQDDKYFAIGGNYHVNLNNGDVLEIYTPRTRKISDYKSFPKPFAKYQNNMYYIHDSLPDNLQGTYFNIWDSSHHAKQVHAQIIDENCLRSSIGDVMPVIWWGSIKQLADYSLVAGVYPGAYLDKKTNDVRSGISFYRSNDNGMTWTILGRICYIPDGIANTRGENEYSEPAYEILCDSTFICIMRSGSHAPMYQSFSYDRGKSWTSAKPISPNGVRPWLLKLKNGVLVLVSGRPGIQIRLSFDGTGKEWSDPIEMQHYMHSDGTYSLSTSCGYASITEADRNSFYLVYSDFTTRNILGQRRKSIWFRKITVNPFNSSTSLYEH